jgi:adenosylmethionine-8-amino-7-oxononanoate aminotransferase
MKAVCEEHGALLILDEVICGMGRTGVPHAWQQDHVVPDIQAIAKGLGGGYVPISGVLIHEKVVSVLAKGSGFFNHGHTYQSHAVACAAALEVQRIIRRENLLQNVVHMGSRLEKGLRASLQHHPNIGDIRGRGLFWCIEFVKNKVTKEPFPSEERLAMKIRQHAIQRGISLHPGSGSVDGYVGDHVLVSPAYNVTKEDVDVIVEKIVAVVTSFFGEF